MYRKIKRRMREIRDGTRWGVEVEGRGIKIAFVYFFIEIQLIYNVVLISAVQQSDSFIYSFSSSFPLWFITGCGI